MTGVRRGLLVGFMVVCLMGILGSVGALGAPQADPDILRAAQVAQINWRQFEGETVRLLLYTLPWQAEFEKYIATFEALTGIDVIVEVYEMQNMRNKRTLDMVSRAGQYDVWAYMPAHDMLEYYYAGWVEPLDGYLSDVTLTDPAWYRIEDVFESALQQGTIEGQLTYLPATLDAVFLMYRKDLFDKHGLEAPTTWTEMWAAASAIRQKEPGVYGIVMRGEGYNAVSTYAQFLKSAGGDWLEPPYYKPGGELPRPIFNSSHGARSLEFYAGILRQFGPPGIASYTWQDSNRLFMDGRAAMIVEDNVFAAEFEDPQKSRVAGKVGYAAFPRPDGRWGTGTSRPAVAGYGLAMSALSKRKGAAWLLMQFATSPVISREIAMTGTPMARKSAWEDEDVRRAFPHADYFEASIISFETGDPFYMPQVRTAAEVRRAIGVAISRAIEGTDPQVALDAAAREVQNIIASAEVQ